jgi:hypothetical protein
MTFPITCYIHVPAATRLVQQGAKPTVLSHSSPQMPATGPFMTLHIYMYAPEFDQPVRLELMNIAHAYIAMRPEISMSYQRLRSSGI